MNFWKNKKEGNYREFKRSNSTTQGWISKNQRIINFILLLSYISCEIIWKNIPSSWMNFGSFNIKWMTLLFKKRQRRKRKFFNTRMEKMRRDVNLWEKHERVFFKLRIWSMFKGILWGKYYSKYQTFLCSPF